MKGKIRDLLRIFTWALENDDQQLISALTHLRRSDGNFDFGMRRLIDHVDWRVRSLAEVRGFYVRFLPAVGFTEVGFTEVEENANWIGFSAKRDEAKPEFVGVIEDREHKPNATRLAFWAEARAEVDRIAEVVRAAGGRNAEGPMWNPEYGPDYYAVFFEDPGGNRLEVCCRMGEG